MTLPSVVRLSLVRTKAPPLPGFTCWNSTILKTTPSTSMWVLFLNWLVVIMSPAEASGAIARRAQPAGPPVAYYEAANRGGRMAVKVGLYVRLEAAEGREDDLAEFLKGAQSLVD